MMAGESIVRLAELRWRQGRWDEAAELFRQVEHEGIAQPGRAELSLSTGDAAAARSFAEKYLRNLPAEDRMERAIGLELMVRSSAAMGDFEAAEEPLAELQRIAKHVGMKPIKASAALAGGLLAAARGDHDKARTCLEDAVDLYERSRAPFEAARARLNLARILVELKRRSMPDARQRSLCSHSAASEPPKRPKLRLPFWPTYRRPRRRRMRSQTRRRCPLERSRYSLWSRRGRATRRSLRTSFSASAPSSATSRRSTKSSAPTAKPPVPWRQRTRSSTASSPPLNPRPQITCTRPLLCVYTLMPRAAFAAILANIR